MRVLTQSAPVFTYFAEPLTKLVQFQIKSGQPLIKEHVSKSNVSAKRARISTKRARFPHFAEPLKKGGEIQTCPLYHLYMIL